MHACTHARTHARSRAHKHMHAVARRQMRVCKLAHASLQARTCPRPRIHAPHTRMLAHTRTHAGAVWRTDARACTHVGACAKVLASLAHDGAQTRTRIRRPSRSSSRRGLKRRSSTASDRCYWIGNGYDGLSGGGAAGVCRRAHAAGRLAARVTAARRQVEEADIWCYIAQVPLPGRFAATCHTP